MSLDPKDMIPVKRPLDICERCKFSAYVDEGHAWFDSPQEKAEPEWHFVCKKCWEGAPKEGGGR